MNYIKKNFLKIFFLANFTLFSCSDLTKRLWEPTHYEEEFKHFLINKQYGYVAFLTDRYHYVFVDNTDLMKEILSWRDRRVLYIDSEKSELYVNKNNQVRGEIMVRSFSENLMPFREATLYNYGFRKDEDGWYYKLKVYGTRYMANPNIQGVLPQLDLSYKVKVYTYLSGAEIAKDIALTPITITLDGIITVGKILLFPFAD